MTEDIEFHVADEWTAVYLDGKLQRVGDSYLADEWLQDRYGVVQIHDEAFMRGQDRRDGVAQTLGEIDEYTSAQHEKRQELDMLLARVDRLKLELGCS